MQKENQNSFTSEKKLSQSYIIKQFDESVKLYSHSFDWPFRKELELPSVEAIIGNMQELRILDYGCSTGNYCRWFQSKKAKYVVGYDICENVLNYAKKLELHAPKNITYISELNEVYAGIFDVVTMIYVLPFTENKRILIDVLKNAFHLLNHHGKLIILTINPDFSMEEDYYLPYGLKFINTASRKDENVLYLNFDMSNEKKTLAANYYSKETINDSLVQAGFKNITIEKHKADNSALKDKFKTYLDCPHAIIITAEK
ncbi:TPA: class I SAM-dependent methyltransferase [Providencia alcalifaciens]